MKTRWWNWLLIALFVPLLFLLPILRNFEKPAPETPTMKAAPVCFMTGDIKNTRTPTTKGLSAVGNMIRLYLDADTLSACKIQFEAYCRTQVAPHPELVPNLRAFFRETGNETGLDLKEGCVITESRPSEKDQPAR
ncbi:MAG TPA: hypothetical protein DCS07_16215 [Bdellovibrionales bacterium]|nr:MAG: hypothetical protein A2Z97_10990 [Bdellovibrionales bacterium GWB1_52_6]OFZ03515.1 MAG: hypothetical protein A2X97_06100 [Bdellovibrionales bacterium GWA1_52_35]OFZ33513.1 MAG: hypothetical protein A2070_08335 [Bdellovibrionales bacterium GWC1_52_8]HAR44150.1 hypothetical protein [Bdellovibrionales bacterium]HCM41102.1 hypothetical protein [Bdellovibrionales bacterium]